MTRIALREVSADQADLFPAEIPEAAQLLHRLLIQRRFGALAEQSSNLLLRVNPVADFSGHTADFSRILRRHVVSLAAIRPAIVKLDLAEPDSLCLVAEDEFPIPIKQRHRIGAVFRNQAVRARACVSRRHDGALPVKWLPFGEWR